MLTGPSGTLPAYLRLGGDALAGARVAPWPHLGTVVPAARLRREPSRGSLGGLQDWPLRSGLELLPAFWGGGLPERMEWLGHDLLRALQSALCLLPELRHQSGHQAAAERGSTPREIADMMLWLQAQECHNINFVTPEHVVPQVIEAVSIAAALGLHLPIVYNTSAYDALESLALLEGIVDIFMPDFKDWSAERSKVYMKAADYPGAARAAIQAMHAQAGPLVFDDDGLARRGSHPASGHARLSGRDQSHSRMDCHNAWLRHLCQPDGRVLPRGQGGQIGISGNQPEAEPCGVPRRRASRATSGCSVLTSAARTRGCDG